MKIHRTFAPRRRFLGATLAVLSTLALAGPANAQNWPDRPIKLLVPFAAGGNIDVTGRLMAARLSEALGQQMVVENRVGGGGIIAMEAVSARRRTATRCCGPAPTSWPSCRPRPR